MKTRLPVIIGMFALVLCFTDHFGQELYKVKGIVSDQDTKTALPDVHIESSKSAVLTDKAGYFAITIRPGDSLHISHVGYNDVDMIAPPESRDTMTFTMTRSTSILKEVTVNDVPTEEELKEKILETKVVVTREEENARANLENARTLYRLGYRPEMNALDNFREAIKPPQGATFFSSNGGGFIKALKNLANPPSVNFIQRKQYTRPLTSLSFFKPGFLAKDSIESDTLAQSKKAGKE